MAKIAAPAPQPPKEPKERDLFRDTPVRYLGYANEVGEAFRALMHVTWVRATYCVACAYVCADANDKKNKQKWPNAEEYNRQRKHAIIDTLLWQGFASVAIPGFTINRICWAAARILRDAIPDVPPNLRKGVVTAMGLCAIPFIIQPIDRSVDWAMERTYRKYTQPRLADSLLHHKRDE
ncbi:hypothetical protein CAPTEDRAFT_168727 [Capitella teleta]|uniref:Mitochondrial fission process protein 1 n=1 Tax=Capitella teleta TaxID=283909 RepID=R7UFT6_CAPTE|nr:hypothetical protein CAPTEDRAFT_168727 [Capitella teleta]|eukprot:ELU02147.1 hypothetical protein CAPTEDRAFT_168727 [Capitella teleta]